MGRLIDIAAFDGVIVDILQLLKHPLFVLDLLRMAAFLPEMMLLLDLVPHLDSSSTVSPRLPVKNRLFLWVRSVPGPHPSATVYLVIPVFCHFCS